MVRFAIADDLARYDLVKVSRTTDEGFATYLPGMPISAKAYWWAAVAANRGPITPSIISYADLSNILADITCA